MGGVGGNSDTTLINQLLSDICLDSTEGITLNAYRRWGDRRSFLVIGTGDLELHAAPPLYIYSISWKAEECILAEKVLSQSSMRGEMPLGL